MTKIYVVESQTPYDGGGSLAVFSSLEKAKKYCESQDGFTEWDLELCKKYPLAYGDELHEKNKGDDTHLNILCYIVDEMEEQK